MSAIVNPRDLLMQAAPSRLLPVPLAPNVIIPALVPDATRPPMPEGFMVSPAISHIIIEHASPVFTVGHGYLRTNLYGALWTGGALPVFDDADKIDSFVGPVTAHATNPGLSWRLWVTWVSRDGEESLPAGGPNGLAAATGQNVEAMVAALTGPGKPFTVLNEPTEINGTVYPAGLYSTLALIFEAQIGRAQIKEEAVDSSRIANLSADKLLAGSIAVGQYLRSGVYTPGILGWKIDGSGLIRAFSYSGERVLDMQATGTMPVFKMGSAFSVLADGSASLAGGNFVVDTGGAVAIKGAILGGMFSGHAWPASGNGFYLGAEGLLLGNANTGGYAEIRDNGNIYTPAFDVINGLMTLKQANVIKTIHMAGNSVSAMNSASGVSGTSTNIIVPAGETMKVVCLAHSRSAYTGSVAVAASLSINCLSMPLSEVADATVVEYSETGYRYSTPPLVVMGQQEVTAPSTGALTVTATATTATNCTVILLGTLR